MKTPALLALLLLGCDLSGLASSLEDDEPEAGVTADGSVGEAFHGWVRYDHPCLAGRTDALHHAGGDTFYVGCGTGAEGRGLWVTDDGGARWREVDGLGTWRVSDIDAGPDGRLFVAGIDTESRDAVALVEPATGAVEPVFTRGQRVDTSFHVGHFARLPSGEAVAESLTGGGLVHRASDEAEWTPLSPWSSDGMGHQILDLEAGADGFYAVGSTISEPPTVFVPEPGDGALFRPVLPLGERIHGELWGIGRGANTWVAVGVDQRGDEALLLVAADAEAGEAEGWQRASLDHIFDGSSWLRGACGRGADLIAVGERQPLRRGTGVVLRSTDGGANWLEITPEGSPESWSRCVLTDDGRLAVAGADGGFAIHFPGQGQRE